MRMKNDNSKLAQLCDQWGIENGRTKVGKWSADDFGANGVGRLYNHAAFVFGTHHWVLGTYNSRWECDDLESNGRSTASGDFWKVFVR